MANGLAQAVNTLFRAFFNICLLKKGPQDLPLSRELLTLCLLLYTAVNILLALTTTAAVRAIASGVLETALVSTLTIIILRLTRHPERWVQTLTALTGTGCILGIMALPLFAGSMFPGAGDFLQALLVILYLILIIWSLAIMGHILRHALDTTLGTGVVFAIIYIVITSVLIGAIVSRAAA
jgi:hypothetical protein